MPTLLQINSTANWGSTGRIAEQIGAVAMSHGWDSYIAYGRYVAPSKSKLIKVGSLFDSFLHLLFSRLSGHHGWYSRRATKALIKKIEQINPDVIHLHNIHGYYINYPLLFDYLASRRKAVVWTMHDCWPFTGHCAHYHMHNCYKWQSDGCRHCKYIHDYPKACYDHTHRNYQSKKQHFLSLGNHLTIVPVSQWLAGQFKQSFFASLRIQPIYNGVDTAIFAPTSNSNIKLRYGIADKILLVGAATVWNAAKGYDDFLRLRTKLSSRFMIMLVGLSQNQIKRLPQGIIGIERTQSQQELAEIYAAADIVLSLSRQETFGLTIAEAMACGTPVIAYNTTALPELITERTGRVVSQVGDVDGVADAIDAIVTSTKEAFSAQCRRRATTYFDKNSCSEKYITLYNELINN